jgi:hypothetical protein
MVSRKDAVSDMLALGLVVGLACSGCAGATQHFLELPDWSSERAVAARSQALRNSEALRQPSGSSPAVEPARPAEPIVLAAADRPPALPPPSAATPGPLASPAPAAPRAIAVTPPAAPPTAPSGPELKTSTPRNPAPVPTPSSSAGNNLDKVQALVRAAAERYATIDSYIVRLRRREQVRGKDRPEELMLFKFRKQPWSVYFKWLGTEGKDREVVYVKGQYEDKLHTLLAAGDMPFAPAGKRMALPPDSVFVRAASRHGITEAGVGVIIDGLMNTLAEIEKGASKVTLRYGGMQQRPEFKTPVESVEMDIPAGLDPSLPNGGRRLFFFDPVQSLPILVITRDDTDHEVEYYCYDHFQYPVKLDDDDFNPDKLWGRGEKK